MNRRALKMLLKSGRFLCFDCRGPYQMIKERNAAEDDKTMVDDGFKRKSPSRGMLFDLSTLNLGIFFKEVSYSDDQEEVFVSTRVYFPYNDEDVSQGGESTSAEPDTIIRVLAKRGAIKDTTGLSAHDQRVLEVLSQLPTFDPFLLLSQRREMEADRPVDNSYFDITEDDWVMIRRPVMEKISLLVSKANQGSEVDVFEQYMGKGGGDDGEEDETRRLMTSAVIDSIWRGEATQGCRQLIRSFHLDEDKTTEILFAWKGINYYEFQYKKYQSQFYDFFKWLGGNESLPRDLAGLEASAVDRFNYRRDRARKLIRATHATVMGVVKDYNAAFEKLVDEEAPKDFQTFLAEAPKNFLTVGLAIGVLAHTATAWRHLTQDGKKPQVKAVELEPFYDFIIAVNGQDFYVAS
ncbi:MAG: hypothetical protein RIB45_06390 [Marivibrio sp.]|uniref:hypothetical protein n=1 Tax=Marivibrio sp. TaxID=2039719 RepID=UPI0032EC5910